MDRRTELVGGVILLALTFAVSWWLNRPAPVIETAKPAEVQADGSQILERAPDAKAKPKQIVPKGAKVERIEQVKVQGGGLKMLDGTTKACPPVTVDMTIVREKDGGRRVIASSPDGEVVGGLDIPVESATAPTEPKLWAAGLSIDPTHQTAGVWLERDVSRFRVGVEINQSRNGISPFGGAQARIRVGWTF